MVLNNVQKLIYHKTKTKRLNFGHLYDYIYVYKGKKGLVFCSNKYLILYIFESEMPIKNNKILVFLVYL